jgi:PAS domain S-box-containing protein
MRKLRLVVLIVTIVGLPCATTPAAGQNGEAISTTGPSEQRPHLVFLGSSNNPPFLWTDETGVAHGFTVDLLKALAREGGFDVSFEIVPRQQRRQLFRDGHGDVTGVQPNTEEAHGTIPLSPLWRVREIVLYATPHRAPQSLDDLKGETVAVMESSSQHLTLAAMPATTRPKIIPVETLDIALERLRRGDVTAVFGHSLGLLAARSHQSGTLDEHELRAVPYLIAARAGREDLQPLFATAYLRLQESGELTEIIERSLMRNSGAPNTSSVGRILLVAIGVGGIALLAMLLWSRSLRREVQRRTSELRAAGERQAMQAHVLSQVTDAIIVTGVDGCVVSWNSAAEAIFGRPAGDAIGQPIATLITNRMAARRDGDLHAALASGASWRGDAEIIRPAGDTVFIEATLRGLTDKQGQPSGTLIVAHDVDARRRVEIEAGIRARQQTAIASLGQRALAGIDFGWLIDQAMSITSNILHGSAVATFERRGQHLVMRAGEGWEHASLGDSCSSDPTYFPAHVLTGEGGVCTVGRHLDDAPPLDAFHVREAVAAGVAVVIPGRSGPYGILLAVDRRDRRFSRDDAHFLQAIANVIGASYERSIIDAELNAELALHNSTLEAAADGILVTDAAGRVRRYNQRLLTMWGFPPEIVANRDAHAWVAWGREQLHHAQSRVDDFRGALGSDVAQSTVLRLRDGRVIERHSQPQLVDGKVDGRVWCYRDVTDREQAEEERRRLEAQMQHVQKLESLGVLAGGIAHDFNNLLVGVLGHAGLALTEVEASSPAHDRIQQIQTTAQRAAELTNQMLAYSGKGRFVLQSADLSEIVGEMTHLLRTAITKNAEIVLDLDRALPAFDGDPAQIRQVIMNLITNASDAIGNSPGTITVQTGRMVVTPDDIRGAWIGADLPEGDYVFAEVRDTGSGMDAATMARIFDPFFTTKFTGRGLGLAAVLGIVRGHKGGIKISSEPGSGTTFRVLLPSTTTPIAPAAAPPRPSAPVRVSGARVLVVDDEAGVRTIARESLKRAGFEVTTVNDGTEAIELLTADRGFRVVLLDMTMPRMNGAECFRRIMELQPDLPVVLTSGYSAQDAVGRFGSAGIAGFIQKPFMPAALVKIMHDAISERPRREVA